MEKTVVVFPIREDKKHSVCYKATDREAAIQSVYIMRTALGKPVPSKVKITIEEA